MDKFFSERLIQARTQAGYSQKKAAEILGITPVTMNRYEKAHREPERGLLIKMAELYNCELNWLLTGADTVAESPATYDPIPRLSPPADRNGKNPEQIIRGRAG